MRISEPSRETSSRWRSGIVARRGVMDRAKAGAGVNAARVMDEDFVS